MPLYTLGGTVAGAGTATAGIGIKRPLTGVALGNGSASAPDSPVHDLREHLTGTSTITASWQRVILFSGFPQGIGSLLDERLLMAGGTAAGAGTLTGTLLHIIGIGGSSVGRGTFRISVPEQIFGVGVLSAFMDVVHVPPICPPCACPPTQFRWLQTFQKGDLTIRLTDVRGNPVGPIFLAYTMFQVLPTGVLHQVGPTDRKPATASVGCYYVTGTAGEGGQPGCWAIRWRYQQRYGDPVVEQYQQFQILDAALARDPLDTTPRACKYGWD